MDKESCIERSHRKACLEAIEVDGIGLNTVFILLMSRMCQASGSILPPLSSLAGPEQASPTDGPGQGARETSADSGCSSLSSFAKSLQKAEALLWSCVNPGARCLLQQCASAYASDEEDSPGALARLAQVEHSLLGLRRCLCVQENPRTETFRGHIKPAASDAAQGTFCYHPTYPSVAKHGATLHALLQHRHHLRLSREYSRRLKGASDFVRHLLALLAEQQQAPPDWGGDPGGSRQLRGLCEELRTHTSHWSGLQRKLRGDPWLRALLLQQHESVRHMKWVLGLVALHAVRLVERYLDVLLRSLAWASRTTTSPARLSDLFQGLEMYNRVLQEQASSEPRLEPAARRQHKGAVGGGAEAYPVERVLGILAAERGRLAAHRLHLLLLQQAQGDCLEQVRWEDTMVPWALDHSSSTRDMGSPGSPPAQEGAGLPKELHNVCGEDKELLDLVLGVLVASTDTLWHHALKRPKQEKPRAEEGQESPAASPGLSSSSLPSWTCVHWLDASYAEAVGALYAQYRPLFWEAAAAWLAQRLEPPFGGLPRCTARAAVMLAQELSQALIQAHVPPECEAALQRLCLHLLSRSVFRSWDQGFCRALGSSLGDRCVPGPRTVGAAHSRTAQLLWELHPPLACALKCLGPRLAAGAASRDLICPGLRLELLTLCLATGQASRSWLMAKAYQHLAAWSLCPFLLVTQGDLQLLKVETASLAELVSGAFPEGRESPGWEQQLCLQIHSTAASIQSFSQAVLQMFSADCKRMSAEIFGQTMPLGKHWRASLQPEAPRSPSEYASAAARSILGPVLQSTQLPALTQVLTAFVEAWMEHILAQKIKFSLQGAFQLKQDFDTVRQLVQSEDSGLSPETQQCVLSLPVFQQMDNAIICLLQQPSSKAYLPSHTWESFRQCCAHHGSRTQDLPAGSLNSLESLDGQALRNSPALETHSADLLSQLQGSCMPESYLPSTQQAWLSLRLHGARRWKVPSLPCTRNSEP
ncbi:coiled-coil domain-containing protein 142 isoform X2 [Carettochelys insculpta]|uniref:coiled-coil domain-containing protein 142 isoform X2 n=2 Tax=Carettochelys insculpta TaxID=44489 RepID=UPI003EBD0587